MALVRLSDYGDIESDPCGALDVLASSTQVVVADTPDEFYEGFPCQLGKSIRDNGGENTNPDYKILVVDPANNCLGWQDKPTPPQYGSDMLKPWVGYSYQNLHINSGTCGVLEVNWRSVGDLEIPAFSVDVKLRVCWTVLWYGAVGSDYALWYPHFGELVVYPAPGNATGFAHEKLPAPASGHWSIASFTTTLNLAAGVANRFVAGMILGCVGDVEVRIAAVAFKA